LQEKHSDFIPEIKYSCLEKDSSASRKEILDLYLMYILSSD